MDQTNGRDQNEGARVQAYAGCGRRGCGARPANGLITLCETCLALANRQPIITSKIVDLMKWLERSCGTLELSRPMGNWMATLSWKRVHSFSDAAGEHSSTWTITRDHGGDLRGILEDLFAAALAAPGQNVGAPVAVIHGSAANITFPDTAGKVDGFVMICTEGSPCLFHREGGALEKKCPGYCEIGGCRDEEVAEVADEESGEPVGVCHAHAAEYHRAKAGLS